MIVCAVISPVYAVWVYTAYADLFVGQSVLCLAMVLYVLQTLVWMPMIQRSRRDSEALMHLSPTV